MMKHILLSTIILISALSCRSSETSLNVVPYPAEVTMGKGCFHVAGAEFHLDEKVCPLTEKAVKAFASKLSEASGAESKVLAGTSGKGFTFVLDGSLSEEAYRLRIGRNEVQVAASGLNGFVYAIQTLKQMLPVEIFGNAPAAEKDWSLPCCTIEDAPRFGYRGMHMDVARHFFDMDVVKRYLDVMEIHKLNTLHWHLTDDQGWRIEIKKYPKLVETGSVRNKPVRYGDGCWLSQEQIREIIDYAASKGITIIPEIDLPGHMLAALAAYPELGCTGGPYEVWDRWGVADDVLCAGKEETMIFLENVLAEIADLFPSEYVHIGGDECPKVRWEECPHCQAKIKELGLTDKDGYKAEHYLQSYVMKRMTDFLNARGKKVIGWDEILEGEVSEDAVIMSWRGASGGLQAARMGNDAIMTPNTHFYFDYYQTLDKENEPVGIGGYIPIEKCYSYEPYVKGMTDEEKAHILGVQANLWTEYIETAEHLEYMLLPRMAALSEVQWCQSGNRSWDRFLDSADDICAIYETAGYNYAKHIFQITGNTAINGKKRITEVSLDIQGDIDIHYTLDGSEPGPGSPVYDRPIEIDGSCTLKATAFREGVTTKTYEKTFHGHKAMGQPVTLLTEPHSSYRYGAPDSLTDGIHGTDNYTCGDWAGWYSGPFEAVVDMKGCGEYSEVSLGVFVFKYDWIFNPTDMRIEVSDNGKDFTEVAYAEYETIQNLEEGNGRQEYRLDFEPTDAKYLKISAGAVMAIPQWHAGAGNPSFVFVDEITVN